MKQANRERSAGFACVATAAVLVFVSGCGASNRARTSGMTGWDEGKARAVQLFGQAQQAERDGNLDKAIELYTKSVGASPSLGAAWNNLGIALMSRGKGNDYVDAGAAFQRAAAALPNDPTPSRNLGLLYQKRGFGEESLRHFEQALAIAPNDRDALRGAAQAGKLLRKSSHEALERLRRAQMQETDPRWLELITLERIRVENDLREIDENS